MSNLDPRIEAVRSKYDLPADAFWQIPQNKQWVCKHAALEIVATKANIEWSAPQVVEASTADGVAVMVVTGKMGDRVEWSTGEASPKNNKNAYPWAMAEKRAKDRVILKLVGIHGLVYSEDEMPTESDPRTTDRRSEQGRREVEHQQQGRDRAVGAAEMKRGLESIEQDLLDCNTVNAVLTCAATWKHVMERDGWTEAYRNIAREKFSERRDLIKSQDQQEAA